MRGLCRVLVGVEAAYRSMINREGKENLRMLGKSSTQNTLEPPPIAHARSSAVELLRVWAAPGAPQQLTLRTGWKDPGAWGVMLVDIARQAAQAYATQGQDPQVALARIRELFDAEWSQPADSQKPTRDT
jgi:hypothetical protein